MKKRLLTGFIIILITAISIVAKLLPYNIGDYVFDIFVLTICLVSAFELSEIMAKMGSKNNKYLATFYGLVYYLVYLICQQHVKFSLILVIELAALIVYFVLAVIVEFILNKGKNFKASTISGLNTVIACLYPTFWFALLININHADAFAGVKNFSLVFVLLVFAIAMLTDTFAYIFGSMIRGPKLAPHISPNKTISGAIAGLIGGVVGALLVFVLAKYVPAFSAVVSMFNLTWWQFALFGFAGSVVGQFGDLFESKLKRNAGIKDSGHILPGHGGMLDRVDSQIFISIFVFFVVFILVI